MFDTQTPRQMLAGQPLAQPQFVGNTPLATRLAQDPSTPPPAPQQQQPPAPLQQQQSVAARHHAMGKAATFLFGQQRDENGEPIKQRPGDVFKS
jgi:hypothetical protein